MVKAANVASESLFADLPEALVEELLSNHKILGQQMTASLDHLQGIKESLRNSLKERSMIRPDASVIRTLTGPTTCAIDGAYAVEKLLSTDIVAIAGVGVEGLTPPSETRYWKKPQHRCSVFALNHHDSTFIVVGAIMLTMELELAIEAPHNVVLLDGSLLTPLIRFNQAITKLSEVPQKLSTLFSDRIGDALRNYKEVLSSPRSDKTYAAVPKYTSRKEIANQLGIKNYEDRAMLSMVLNSGEVVGPVKLIQQNEYPNFIEPNDDMINIGKEILSLIHGINVVYYRPSDYFPALRIEIGSSAATNQSELSILVEALRLQCSATGIFEPYPLYMADRMVKHLGNALPALRRATTQEMAMETSHDVANIYQAMHGYRTEHGRS